jgi:hypothetical protein
LYTISRNVNQCSHCGNQYRVTSNELKTELPYDPAIPLLNVYLKDSKSAYNRHTCPSMFIVHYSQQTNYAISLDVHRWMDKENVVHIHNIFFIKKNEIMSFAGK